MRTRRADGARPPPPPSHFISPPDASPLNEPLRLAESRCAWQMTEAAVPTPSPKVVRKEDGEPRAVRAGRARRAHLPLRGAPAAAPRPSPCAAATAAGVCEVCHIGWLVSRVIRHQSSVTANQV